MTITDFLLARIAEDEALARDADVLGVHLADSDGYFGARPGDHVRGLWSERMDPTRVLAECEAKRRIVDNAQDPGDDIFTRCLAAVYADHPDYDESWRP